MPRRPRDGEADRGCQRRANRVPDLAPNGCPVPVKDEAVGEPPDSRGLPSRDRAVAEGMRVFSAREAVEASGDRPRKAEPVQPAVDVEVASVAPVTVELELIRYCQSSGTHVHECDASG
jgi:hypothetical protein